MRRGFSVMEMVVATALALMVLGGAFGILRFVRRSGEQTLAPLMGLQLASRSALVQLIKELQESVEFVRPQQGASLPYFVARDKTNRMLTGYLAPEPRATPAARALYRLYLHRYDYEGEPDPAKQRVALGGIERAAFTALSAGVLQVHLTLHEQGQSYTLLTTVRARNVLSEAEL